MAYTTIDDPSAYFQTALYTGNGGSSTQVVTNDGNSDLKPDWIWLKNRTSARWNLLNDSTRGASYNLYSNEDDPEDVGGSGGNTSITSFNSDGFTLATDTGDGGWNEQGDSHVAWQWKANGGTTASNSDGSITSTVQANTTAGFSIVTYTGNATAGATIGHGLGAVPNWIIVKDRDASKNWVNYHESIGNDRSITLNTTDAQSASTDHWHNTTPTSSVFYLGDYSHVNATDDYVAYCFAEKQGYSKFGSYTGVSNDDGTFVYTGFAPAWVMIKRTDTAKNWYIFDNKRPGYNVINRLIAPNLNSAEVDGSEKIDLLSNGFKLRQSFTHTNTDGGTFIYMAFAESPFVSSEGVPTTAR